MGAGTTTAALSARPTRWGRSRYAAAGAVLLAIALVVVTSMVGRELVSIQSLAADVQSVVLPQIMARQQRAIWTESLRSAANVVVYAPDLATRHEALAKAEQLAANVTHADVASRAALEDAWASIRLAARKADEAQRVGEQMRAMLHEADSLIGDMSANLSSIVDDSGVTLARLIREAVSAGKQNGLSRQVLEEVLAINTTSHELLASLDRGRIILASAMSLEVDEALKSAATHFVAIGSQLKARVDTLRGNSDYEYLPAMIDRFNRLDAVFAHQRTRLALQREAIAASTSAKLRLGVVRETMAADAAGAAETSVATIAASARRIKLTAAAMVAILIVAAAVRIKCSRQTGKRQAAASPACRAADQPAAFPEPALSATAASLEGLIKAQGNLEHWRQTAIAKLSGAVTGALEQIAERSAGEATEHDRQLLPAEPRNRPSSLLDAVADPLALLEPNVTRVVGLIEDIAAQTSQTGLKAVLDGVRGVRGTPDGVGRPSASDERTTDGGDPASPTEALAAATAAADAVTEQVGATIGEINAVAHRADRTSDLQQAAAEIVDKIEHLGDQLSAIRDRGWRRPAYVG